MPADDIVGAEVGASLARGDAAWLRRAAGLVGEACSAPEAGEPPVHFVSDIHGEALAFDYLARSCSGEVGRLVAGALDGAGLPEGAAGRLNAMLCYPEEPAFAAEAREAGVELAPLARRARSRCVGRLHMAGDIWDRGPRGDMVMDTLMSLPAADVQWGNHDVCWMGAAGGDETCVATVLRNNLKYGNTEQFEVGYGIDLEPLRSFAGRVYADEGPGAALSPVMKAISVLLFKCEGQAVRRHPEWHMEGRLLLDKVDLSTGTVTVAGKERPLRTRDFPTLAGVPGSAVGGGDPYGLDSEERAVMDALVEGFLDSARLQAQVQWLYDNGSVYLVDGRYLLVHGCVPMEEGGGLAPVECGDGRSRSGRALLDWTDSQCRRAWSGRRRDDLDWMGFFWTGWRSTFMGRVVKTFERTYLDDKDTWEEPEDPYYALTAGSAERCGEVLREFGLDPREGVIVNGHTPVKLPKGQSPVRGGGRRLVIDGGFCRAYRKSTGVAGFTLVDEGGRARLVTHADFPGRRAVVEEGADMGHESEELPL